MFHKVSVLFLALCFAAGQEENHDWAIAVVTDNKIELLQSNGSLAGEPFGNFYEFTKLRALTFDNVRHQFVVSDMDQENDTIFAVQLTKETDIRSIVEDLPDDVQGLAIDPIADILYWTDSSNRTISYVRLNDSSEAEVLFQFDGVRPHDITIDVCHQYIYWTISDINFPSIQRCKIGTTHRETIIESDLHRPTGISVDYKTQRIFWADIKEGVHYSIESADLDGQNREIVYEGTHCKPFGVAADSGSVYWTDVDNNILWMIEDYRTEKVARPIRHFSYKPMGIIAKNLQIKSLPDCQILLNAIEIYTEPTAEIFQRELDLEVGLFEQRLKQSTCLNGVLVNSTCRCNRGYSGAQCEISLCHNYCLHGNCVFSSYGYHQCKCFEGFKGSRCESDLCGGYCLNGGKCLREEKEGDFPTCRCLARFRGRRCEIPGDDCDVFCRGRRDDVIMSEKEILCRCKDGRVEALKTNISSLSFFAQQDPIFFDHFQDIPFLVVCCLVLIMFVTIVILASYTCALRKRPRIKKRIIVNKNVTPLTYRPQPTTEQCEITIENCCNMNICETPCFEPPKIHCLQAKNDDKKKLLSNMENGDDSY